MSCWFKSPAWLIALILFFASCNPKTTVNTTHSTLPPTAFQSDTSGLWHDIENTFAEKATELPLPSKFRLLKLDFNGMKTLLSLAPKEKNKQNVPGVVVNIPMPDGTFVAFSVYETEVMAPELAARFPEIKTFAGSATGDQTLGINLDFNPTGFHARILSPTGSIIIDTNTRNDVSKYLCYYNTDSNRDRTGRFEKDTIK